MTTPNWTTATVCLAGSEKFTVKARPLNKEVPMGLVHITVSGDGNDCAWLLTVDQADELEQALEQARRQRVFQQQELATAEPQAAPTTEEPTETITKPDDAHSGGWEARVPK